MKAKVRLTDRYTGRYMDVIVCLENTEADRYEYTHNCLSEYQRKKIENFFGKMNAYHCEYEIIHTYN